MTSIDNQNQYLEIEARQKNRARDMQGEMVGKPSKQSKKCRGFSPSHLRIGGLGGLIRVMLTA